MTDEYVKADLEDHADLSRIAWDGGRHSEPNGGRRSLLATALGVENDAVEIVREGGYQGTVLMAVAHEGRLWLVKDAYGSCSGCDGFLAADSTEAYRDYVVSMMRNAYAFDSADDAAEFLQRMGNEKGGTEAATFAYGWSPLVEDGLDAIGRIDF